MARSSFLMPCGPIWMARREFPADFLRGGMAEWFKAAVLKTAFRVTGTGVRIPLPPPYLPFDKL
jgi:hypothetical protein